MSDLPLQRRRRDNPHPGNVAACLMHRERRESAYGVGRREFASLAAMPTFRDFVCLYIAEGTKRSRNSVAIANSTPAVCILADRWIKAMTRRKLEYWLQHHADQSLPALRRFWGSTLAVPPDMITLQRKSNSGQLRGRTWRSRYGVLTIRTNDTLFRARLQAWMDCLQEEWLDSAAPGA
ncbi:MAG: hypothetical protein H0U84_08335 [Thermoleophilaceae bacterium]|nr:hypothetical protein [Thermoleophilaceae bacterium]